MLFKKDIEKLINKFKPFSNIKNIKVLLDYVKLSGREENIKSDKTLYAVVGPPGSGKTTFVANLYSNGFLGDVNNKYVPLVNRFYLNKEISLIDEIKFKVKLLKNGLSFLTETASFDKDYLDFLKVIKNEFGYKICLIYLTKNNNKENVEMVKKRTRQGGHGRKNVELDHGTVEMLSDLSSENFVNAMLFSDVAYVINNISKTKENDAKLDLVLHKNYKGLIVYNGTQKNAYFLQNRLLKSKINFSESSHQVVNLKLIPPPDGYFAEHRFLGNKGAVKNVAAIIDELNSANKVVESPTSMKNEVLNDLLKEITKVK